MLRKFLCVAALAAFSVPAQAGVLSSLMTFNGNPDKLQDDSVAQVIDTQGNVNVLEVGDLLQGAFQISSVSGLPSGSGGAVPTGQSVYGVFSLEVLTVDATQATFGAATGANSVLSLLGGQGVDLNGFTDDTAGIALIESSTSGVLTSGLTPNNSGTAASISDPNLGSTNGIPTQFGSDFETVFTLGFDGVDDAHVVVAETGVDLTDLTSVPANDLSSVQIAKYYGTYTILEDTFGSSVTFLPLVNSVLSNTGDVIITNGEIGGTDNLAYNNGWLFQDDGDFFINAVPEPSSFLAFAGLLGLGATVRRRRKNS
jgi:hypothetical protein